jgi:outer membrane protein assembly factor BamD (BamD/ComL family)
VYAALAPRAAPRTVYVDRIVPLPSAAPAAPATATAAIEAIPAPSAAQAASAGQPGRGSQLSAERILLDEARAALAQGDSARALDRLERHRRTFQVPLLAEERDAMWVQALVKAGRYDEARAHASAFRKRSPDSLFSSVVDSAIDSIP